MHEFTLISTIAAGFGLALVFGYLASRLRAPPGRLPGGRDPHRPRDPGICGRHGADHRARRDRGHADDVRGGAPFFSIRDLMAVQRISVPGAIVQIAAATGLATLIGRSWGWDLGPSLVFGTALSVASTVVLLRALEAQRAQHGKRADRSRMAHRRGPVRGPGAGGAASRSRAPGREHCRGARRRHASGRAIVLTLGKVAAFVALMLVVGRRVLPRVLWLVARTGSRELFTLAVHLRGGRRGLRFGELFSVSFALGAFFAGMMLRESALSHRAAEEVAPAPRRVFRAVLRVGGDALRPVGGQSESRPSCSATVAIVMLGKTTAAVALVLALRYPINTALTVGAGLAQIGEFSSSLRASASNSSCCHRRPQPHPGRGAHLHHAEPGHVRGDRPAGILGALQLRSRPRAGAESDPLAELPATVDVRTLTGHVLIVGCGGGSAAGSPSH